MTISRDTIIDLLPLYLSGEASPATQELVRDALARDPELARLAGQEQSTSGATAMPAQVPDLEAISFQRTRRRLTAQRWAFGLGWLFTAITFSTEIQIERGHVTGVRLALVQTPLLFGALAAAAVLSWVTYFALRRRW